MMVAFRIISLILIGAGAIITYSAKPIVEKLKLDEKMTADEAEEFSEDKIKEYKFTKAMVRVKTAGLLLMLPGVFLALYAFRK
jgi:polyhydroxyalkanoate synthesis regulator phasin